MIPKTEISGEHLIVRADAGTEIGTGHVMRCLALAQAWQEAGGQATFVTAVKAPALQARLQAEGMEVVNLSAKPGGIDDAVLTTELAGEKHSRWIVADGYHFGASYQESIKDAGLSLLFIDDYGHAQHYFADIVVNQNLHAGEDLYVNREPYTLLLLGPRYVLLRKEFLKWRHWRRGISDVARNILVTLGGSDSHNLTLKVIQALNQMDASGLEVKVVVGPSNPNIESLHKELDLSAFSFQLSASVTDMPDLMARADMAVTAAGTTSLELAFMGLPSIVMVMADNQRPVAKELDATWAAISLGWHENISTAQIENALTRLISSPIERTQLARRSQGLVDGMGAARAVTHMQRKDIRLRPVREEDCRLVWEWANDPDARAVSFSSEPIPWDEHVRWFNSKLADTGCIFYISINGKGTPVGQIRFDSEGEEAMVSVSIGPEFRGKGYGSAIIWLASEKVFDASDIAVIHAHVKRDNEPSIRAFEKAGYTSAGTEEIKGHQAIFLDLYRET